MNRSFSRPGYADLLNAARDCGYQIRPLRDAFREENTLTLLLRHDVDFSLRLALEMAELENEQGITATYHVLPHNDFYAPFSPKGRASLRRIIELGHEIGLHCDGAVYPAEPEEYRRAVCRDIETLTEITGKTVVSASQHRPVESQPVDLGDFFEVQAYAPALRKKFAYISDSAMSWRSTTPWDLFPLRRNAHLLIHPIWWMAVGSSRKEKFEFLKKDRTQLEEARLDAELAYIERCLAEREVLDARLARQWGENVR